jgi:hypothetical protein
MGQHVGIKGVQNEREQGGVAAKPLARPAQQQRPQQKGQPDDRQSAHQHHLQAIVAGLPEKLLANLQPILKNRPANLWRQDGIKRQAQWHADKGIYQRRILHHAQQRPLPPKDKPMQHVQRFIKRSREGNGRCHQPPPKEQKQEYGRQAEKSSHWGISLLLLLWQNKPLIVNKLAVLIHIVHGDGYNRRGR